MANQINISAVNGDTSFEAETVDGNTTITARPGSELIHFKVECKFVPDSDVPTITYLPVLDTDGQDDSAGELSRYT